MIFFTFLLSQRGESFEYPRLHSGRGGDRHALADFFGQNSISNNFYLKLFSIRCLFLAVSAPN